MRILNLSRTNRVVPALRRYVPSIALLTGVPLLLAGCGGLGSSSGTKPTTTTFVVTNLVADTSGKAPVTDSNMTNPWGMAYSPSGPFWVSDNTSGLSTLYNGSGAIQGLVVTIPAAGGGSNGPVTGQVFNATSGFALPGGAASAFIFDSEDGLITAWGSGTNAVTVSDQSATGAVYKGLAMATNGSATFLYAANFNANEVDVFDSSYNLTSHFTDPGIPAGFAPFNVQTLNGKLYVTYAKQDSAKHDDVRGAGNGYVDIFNTDGTLVKELVSQGALNSPWGLAIAPSSFGTLSGALLVGNFGDGTINAYNATTGASLGPLKDSTGASITIPNLWAIMFGNGGGAGPMSSLYFTAGPNHEANGLFGTVTTSP